MIEKWETLSTRRQARFLHRGDALPREPLPKQCTTCAFGVHPYRTNFGVDASPGLTSDLVVSCCFKTARSSEFSHRLAKERGNRLAPVSLFIARRPPATTRYFEYPAAVLLKHAVRKHESVHTTSRWLRSGTVASFAIRSFLISLLVRPSARHLASRAASLVDLSVLTGHSYAGRPLDGTTLSLRF